MHDTPQDSAPHIDAPPARSATVSGARVFVDSTQTSLSDMRRGRRPGLPQVRATRPVAEAALHVVLISDFELLRQGLAGLMANRRETYELAGWHARLEEPLVSPGARPPDVVLLDIALPVAPEALIAWVKQLSSEGGPRVLLLGHPLRAELQNRALLAGARGVIERSCPYEQMLLALTHVHRGNLWLDPASAARLLQSVRRREATDNAATGAVASPAEQALRRLSERERDILHVLLQHASAPAKALAQHLSISESTLRNHLTSIYGKLGVRNRNGLLFHAMVHGLGKQLPEP